MDGLMAQDPENGVGQDIVDAEGGDAAFEGNGQSFAARKEGILAAFGQSAVGVGLGYVVKVAARNDR